MPEQRRAKRFELRLPLEIVRAGALPTHRTGETRNLSSAGVLFTSESEIEIGQPIEYYIKLPSGAGGRGELLLRCVGKVIRLEHGRESTERPVAVAATLERYEFIRRGE